MANWPKTVVVDSVDLFEKQYQSTIDVPLIPGQSWLLEVLEKELHEGAAGFLTGRRFAHAVSELMNAVDRHERHP
jgi:hypothetical protein